MKLLYSLLGFTILLLLIQLLSSNGGVAELASLKKQLATLDAENHALFKQNQLLEKEVQDLQSNTNAIETIARQKLGMIKQNEVFIQVIELPPHLIEEKVILPEPSKTLSDQDKRVDPVISPVMETESERLNIETTPPSQP